MRRRTSRNVLWDVDTQVDFVHRHGKLAVPGATEAPRDAAARRVGARAWRRARGLGGRPRAQHPVISTTPTTRIPFRRTTCVAHAARGRSPRRAGRPAPARPRRLPAGLVAELVAGRREILLLKKSFDVFTSPNAEAVVDVLDPDEAILFGVATDVCD